MSKRFLPLVILASLCIGFGGGFYYHKYQSPLPFIRDLTTDISKKPSNVDFDLFWQTWNLVHDRYVDKDKIKDQDLIYGAIEGMVGKVGDPYTVFFTPKDNESFSQEINGSFGGVGIEIGLRNNILTVIAPIKGSPAEKAGIMAGDVIVKIDSKSTDGMKVEEAVNLIRGKNGTSVKLGFMRKSFDKPHEATIIRDTIKIPAVTWEMVDGTTAHLQVFIFNKNVDEEFQKAVNEIVASKADRIILDLRSNPGGLLDSAVNLAGYFLDSGSLVTTEKFSNGTQNEYRTDGRAQLKKYPIVILINKGSASASEILTGTLKDNRAITTIGEKSFGKGSVQEVIDLPQRTSVKITIAKWYTPKGISINENGIAPDVTIERTEADINANKDPQLLKAEAIVKTLPAPTN